MIKAIFCDIGGVCLSNAWEAQSRQRAAEHFSLDYQQLEKRHHTLFEQLERGEMSLHDYLGQVVFYQPRPFTENDFIQFMQGESKPYKETLDIFKDLRKSGEYLLSTVNNESLELNDFRIKTFGLRECFSLFFSSCFLGIRKPHPRIYEIALNVTRQKPQESLFIDDRKENVEAAQALRMNTIHLKKPADLPQALKEYIDYSRLPGLSHEQPA